MSRRYIVLFSLCAGLLLSGWQVRAEQSLPRLHKPIPAPSFVLPTMDGGQQTLAQYRGMPLIVNFWATWCPPCRKELPSMNRAWQTLRQQGIGLVAIDVGEDEDTIFTFSADYPMDFPVLLDSSGDVVAQWPVKGLPTTFVLDPQGNIVYRAIGGREWDDPVLLDKVRALRLEHRQR